MIESLYDNPIDVGYTEGDQLSSELLRTIEPYFNEDILTIDGDVMVRWLYNLMYIARRVDLGLAHSIQHNHIAKNYVMMASGSALKDKINNSAYHETIGAHATLKPSDNITMQDNVLNGSKHWLTNLTVANYVALNIIEPYKNHTSSKVIFDLDKIGGIKLMTSATLINYLIIVLPVLMILIFFMANKAILKDEKLVKSADRIR